MAGLLIAAPPALALFPEPDISGGPDAGQHVADARPTFSISDGGNPLSWCFVNGGRSVNGGRVNDPCAGEGDSGSSSSATPNGSLSDGTHTLIAATGPDNSDPDPFATRYAVTSRTFVVDTTGPALDLPANISVQAASDAGAVVTYDVSAHDAGDDKDASVSCYYLTPANPAPSGSLFPIGTWAITCDAEADSLGNTSTDGFTVTVRDDETPPSVPQPSAPGSGAALFNPAPTFGWQASDPTGHVAVSAYEILIDGQPAQVPASAPTLSYTPTPLASGAHSWQVRAMDARGRWSDYSAPRGFFVVAPAAPVIVSGPPELTSLNKPKFDWSTKEDSASYQWRLRSGSGAVIAESDWLAAPTFTFTTALKDGDYSFEVRQRNVFGLPGSFSAPWPFSVETAPPRILLSGSRESSPQPGRTNVGTRADIEVIFSEQVRPLSAANLRVCVGLCGAPIDGKLTVGEDAMTFEPVLPLRPGTTYQVQLVGVADLAGNQLALPSPGWTWTFRTAQTVPPPAPVTGLTLTPGLAQVGLDWQVPAGGSLGKIRVVRREGVAPVGPADPAAVTFDLGPAARSYTDTRVVAGVRYFYALYSFDAFGNPAEAAASGDVVPLAPPEAPVTPPQSGGGTTTPPKTSTPNAGGGTVVRGLLNPARLKPNRGTRMTTLRPLLRWKGIGKRARLYNVQIFLGSKKVLSAFPRTAAYRVPKGRLKRGKTYLWRVWPYIGRGYTKKPLGVSYFVTATKIQAAKPAAGAGS